MATIADDIDTGRPRASAKRRSRFYFWQASVCAAIAIFGFIPTYWLQIVPPTFVGPALLHIHGLLCTAWVLFLMSQTWLVSELKIRNHRYWGMFGISLATAVIVVGIAVAIVALKSELGRGYGDAARSFLATPLAAIARFAIFTGAAIACVNRPEWHKRLMIVGTVGLIEAAAARFGFLAAMGHGPGLRPGLLPPPPAIMPVVVGSMLQLIVVAGMIHDRRTRGAVHPAWIVGLIGSVAVILLKVPLSQTAGWVAFADWTTRLAG